MDEKSLKKLLDDLDAQKSKYPDLQGMGDSAALQITKSRPPSGIKIRTPFGDCPIMNCMEVEGGYRTVFLVTYKQLKKFYLQTKKD